MLNIAIIAGLFILILLLSHFANKWVVRVGFALVFLVLAMPIIATYAPIEYSEQTQILTFVSANLMNLLIGILIVMAASIFFHLPKRRK